MNNIDCKTVVFGRFRKARSAVSAILECEVYEPHTPVDMWGEKTTVGFSYNEFVLSGGHIMLLRWQKLLDSSTHIFQRLSITRDLQRKSV